MLSIIALLLSGGAQAQEHRTVDFNFEQPPEGVGLGIIIGDPSGLSLAVRRGEHHVVQVHFGYNFRNERIHISGDYLYNLVILDTPEMAGVRFPVYLGIGARYQNYGVDFQEDAGFGIRVPFGMALLPRSLAIDPFVELVPVMLIAPETKVDLEGGVGIRLYF
jgi:hypothetical protein